jgi:hypothetical protein
MRPSAGRSLLWAQVVNRCSPGLLSPALVDQPGARDCDGAAGCGVGCVEAVAEFLALVDETVACLAVVGVAEEHV